MLFAGEVVIASRSFTAFSPYILDICHLGYFGHDDDMGGVRMGVRNVEREELRRMEAKTLDARFRVILEQGLNCSPFEAEAVVVAVAGLRCRRGLRAH